MLLFTFGLLDGQLQLADHFPHKHVIDHDIVSRVFQLVFDTHQLEFAFHALAFIQNVHSLQ